MNGQINDQMTGSNNLSSLVCWRFRIDGFVSNECKRRRFLPEAIAAAAATPAGPNINNQKTISLLYVSEQRFGTSNRH